MKKWLSLLLAAAMLLSLVGSALAETTAAGADDEGEAVGLYAGKTVILHSNDVHGNIEGYAYIAAQKAYFESEGAEVILADAGDYSQGTTYVAASKGATAIEMMNAAGYDVATLGNHEFDFGYAQLKDNLSNANFEVICADVFDTDIDGLILPATAVVERGGVKIGFFGMETPETATKVNPGLITEIDFATFDKLYESAQLAIDELKAQECDLIIGLVHLGVDGESAANGYRSIDLWNNVDGVDFLIDGHSHTVMTEAEGGLPIQSTGTKFAYVGAVVIDNETKAIEDHFLIKTAPFGEEETAPEGVNIVSSDAELEKDEAVLAAAKAIMDAVDAEYAEVFASTEVLMNGERAPGNRTEETNLGDLITDAMVWSVVKEGGIENAEPNAVVGITNGGGIRAAIEVGEITKNQIVTVLPFGNTVAVIYVTGEELLEALEASTYATPDSLGGFPQTSGIVWTLDTTKEFDQGELYIVNGKETTYYAPASIQRVTIETINGEPFDLEKTYAVVTNNFCAAGGDTYAVFFRAYDEGSGFDTGIPMDQALMAYITEELGGTITAEQYGEPQGRLTILTAPAEEEAEETEEAVEEVTEEAEEAAEEVTEETEEAVEEVAEETEEAAEEVSLIGVWDLVSMTLGGEEYITKELLDDMNATATVELKEDGTLVQTMAIGDEVQSEEFPCLVDEDTITIGDEVYGYTLEGNVLTLTFDGETMVLTKAE